MISAESERVLTVSQLTRSIKKILESEYRFVRLTGEISNLRTPFSGHSYFTLKDDSSQIRGVLFKQQKRFVELALQDGQEVVCFGRITVYEPRGEYQFVIDSIELFGTGKLRIHFDQLKKKLFDRGYFAPEIKKALPTYPKKIVVVSSPTGAAIQDFLKISRNRRSTVHIQILPVRVQGKEAAGEIAQAIQTANSTLLSDVDIIVLCRGGGSLEDLWAFNEEQVAEAIHSSKIPVVTGIGHEIDFTIADFCADYRCPTPTGVAEQIIPDSNSLLDHITTLQKSLDNRIRGKLTFFTHRLHHSLRLLGDMKNIFSSAEYRLQLSTTYFLQAMKKNIGEKENTLQTSIRKLQAQAPKSRIALQEKNIQMLKATLQNQIERILDRKQAEIAQQAALLNSVSPLATLGRGYSIVRKFNEGQETYSVISQAEDTKVGEELNILLSKGELDCVVKKIN